jgi:hypothetical protein
MTDNKTPEESARDDAAHADAVERERKMNLFRAGKLGFIESEQLIAEECLKGDMAKRKREEQDERDRRALGAKLRAGTI